jgi:hypothetical protein
LEKAQVEAEINQNSTGIPNEKASLLYQLSSGQIKESLKTINQETHQLSQLLLQEKRLVKELCSLLKLILKRLQLSFNLPPHLFPQASKTLKTILNDEAHLIFLHNQSVKSIALEGCPPQVVFDVASFIIPELSKALAFYKKKVSSRVNVLNRINEELRRLHNTFSDHSENMFAPSGIEDKVLTSKRNLNGNR